MDRSKFVAVESQTMLHNAIEDDIEEIDSLETIQNTLKWSQTTCCWPWCVWCSSFRVLKKMREAREAFAQPACMDRSSKAFVFFFGRKEGRGWMRFVTAPTALHKPILDSFP